MQTQSAVQNASNRQMHINTPFIVNNEGRWWEMNGRRISEAEFLALYPLAEQVRVNYVDKGDNIGTANI